MTRHLDYVVAFALALTGVACAAAEPLPNHLVGTWDTGTTPFADGTRQMELYLAADGSGALLGVRGFGPGGAPAAAAATGAGKDRPLTMVMFIEAKREGDTITTKPAAAAGASAQDLARMTMTCHYESAGPKLVCRDPLGVTLDMARSSASMTDDVSAILASARTSPDRH